MKTELPIRHGDLETRNPKLASDLNTYFKSQLESFNQRLKPDESFQSLIGWAREYTEEFILSRLDRADDLKKPVLQRARELALAFIGEGNHHFFVVCIDGRNMPAVMLSHVPHVGGVMRTQAGELFGFDLATDGSVIADPDSFEVGSIERLLTQKPGHTIHYSLDSHEGCAARAELAKGTGETNDGGLASDIRRKKIITRGIVGLREKLRAKGETDVANIIPQFFSYNPHDGTMTMGLEMFADEIGSDGFTPEVLEVLKMRNEVVNTWEFLNDATVIASLEAEVKPADFRNIYAESMLSNWEAITKLYAKGEGKVYKQILISLTNIYTSKEWKIGDNDNIEGHEISHKALENKAKVMLKNLVTRWSIAKNEAGWPYHEHQEQGVVITEGGYAPFKGVDVFSVFSREDNPLMLKHLHVAHDLIRRFRGAGNIKDPLNQLELKDFERAPIVFVNKAINRNLSEADWSELEKFNLNHALAAIDWDNFSVRDWQRDDVAQLLRPSLGEVNTRITEQLIDSIYEVFDRFRSMAFDMGDFRSLLFTGKVIVVNVLTDGDRRARLVVPFVV